MKIDKIETWTCDLPLARPVNLGSLLVSRRSYLVVRVTTDDGLTGECVIQSRGAPLDVVLMELLAPRLFGRDPRDVHGLHRELGRDLILLGMDGIIGRAWSAVEICLQGLRAQSCGWPLWRLLGGNSRELPVLIVEGYAMQGEEDAAFTDRLVERVKEGFDFVKIEAGHYTDGAQLIRNIESFRTQVGDGPRIVLDMAWAWADPKSRQLLLRCLEHLGVSWIEDPFTSDRTEAYRALRASTSIAVGGGDETTRSANIHALMDCDALDVVRLDATTMGGVEAVRRLSHEAVRRGLLVSYHVHPQIHEHLVLGLGAADHIEMFPADREFDRTHDLLADSLWGRVKGGRLTPTQAAGNGFHVDFGKLAPFVTRRLEAMAG